jgi:hypothetical protein
MLALREAATQNGAFAKAPELWSELSASIQTDLSLNDVLWMTSLAERLDDNAIKLRQIDRIVTQGFVAENGAQVLAWNPEVLQLVLEEAFEPPPVNVAAQASARVAVYNASGRPDWDDLAVSRLVSNNFAVALPDDPGAPFSAESVIYDYSTTGKGSRLPQLMRLFNVQPENVIAQPDPNSAVTYRLLVGSNYDSCRPAPPPVNITPTPSPAPSVTP